MIKSTTELLDRVHAAAEHAGGLDGLYPVIARIVSNDNKTDDVIELLRGLRENRIPLNIMVKDFLSIPSIRE